MNNPLKVNSLPTGKFCILFCCLLIFFEIIFFQKNSRNTFVTIRVGCQTDWMQIMPFVLSNWVLNDLQ